MERQAAEFDLPVELGGEGGELPGEELVGRTHAAEFLRVLEQIGHALLFAPGLGGFHRVEPRVEPHHEFRAPGVERGTGDPFLGNDFLHAQALGVAQRQPADAAQRGGVEREHAGESRVSWAVMASLRVGAAAGRARVSRAGVGRGGWRAGWPRG